MRKFIFIFFALIPSLLQAQTNSKTALLLIDIQDFYFPGGNSALVEPEAAAEKAALLLADFRSKNHLVIHVRHDYEPGGSIHTLVEPIVGEKIITKKEVNSFKDTDLLAYLNEKQIDTLVIAGMQTHLCLEGGVRAAHDFGFICLVVQDACATKDLVYDSITIPAKEVHFSTLHTLMAYSIIIDADDYLKSDNE
ncbi:MAG: isochorismatase family protein [Bacteroidales bacterium]|jgi:nicotinamidase-related amidase|nr:isochorismatase family protein [Bacteroidales bacterium]